MVLVLQILTGSLIKRNNFLILIMCLIVQLKMYYMLQIMEQLFILLLMGQSMVRIVIWFTELQIFQEVFSWMEHKLKVWQGIIRLIECCLVILLNPKQKQDCFIKLRDFLYKELGVEGPLELPHPRQMPKVLLVFIQIMLLHKQQLMEIIG